MHTGGVEGWKKSKYEYRDQLEVRTETSSFLTRMLDIKDVSGTCCYYPNIPGLERDLHFHPRHCIHHR